jgi:urease accessory protein
MHAPAMVPSSEARGWQARLDLRLGLHHGRTVVLDRAHEGPLQVQRAFYPEGPALCHVYLLHPPGGLVAGDALSVTVQVEAGARALITTPAATKVYRGDQRPPARVRQQLEVAAGAALEWFPQETIVFQGGRVQLETRVELQPDSAFAGWEVVCLGRPAAGEGFAEGQCRQRIELWRAGQPLCLERARLDGGSRALAAAWGLRGAPVTGTMFVTPVAAPLAEIRALPLRDGELGSATLLDDVLVCRYLGKSGERARGYFSRIWELVRPALLGRPTHSPRIWST